MLDILIKESYAMPSCFTMNIFRLSKCEGRKNRTVFPIRSVGNHRKPVVLAGANKISQPLGTNSPCFLCFVPSFPLICLKVFTPCYRDKKNEHWVVTGEHKMSRSRKTDMTLTLVTDKSDKNTENTLIITNNQ